MCETDSMVRDFIVSLCSCGCKHSLHWRLSISFQYHDWEISFCLLKTMFLVVLFMSLL